MIKDVLNTSPGKNKTIKNIKIALEHFFKRNKNKKTPHYLTCFSLSLCRAFYNRYLRILWRKELCSWWYCVQNIQQVWWRRRTENYSNQYIRNSKSQAEKTKQKNGNANYYKKYEIKIFWKLEKTFPNHITVDIVRMISLNR